MSSASVFDFTVLAKARASHLGQLLREVQTYGKREKSAAGRVALAEIEEELRKVRERWMEDGLISTAEQQEFASGHRG